MIVVTLALFTDGLLYGLIISLLPYSPAKLSEDWMYEILSASYALGVIITTPISGFFSDRLGRRYSMILGVVIQAMAILIFANTTHFSCLLIAKLAQGIAASTTWTSGLALITDHFTEKRAQMLGYALLGNTIGLVIGPLLGGFLFEKFNFQFPNRPRPYYNVFDPSIEDLDYRNRDLHEIINNKTELIPFNTFNEKK